MENITNEESSKALPKTYGTKEDLFNSFFNDINFNRDDEIQKWELENKQKQKEAAEKKRIDYYKSEKSGVPKRFWEESLNSYQPQNEQDTKNLKVVKCFMEEPDSERVLLITGVPGNGKTHLGCSIIRETGGLYTTSEDLLLAYESSQNFNSGSTQVAVINKYSKVNMLVIDEVGRAMDKSKEAKLLGLILHKRYGDMLPTCIISNLDKLEIVKLLGDSVYDRLKETCRSVTFNNKSYRDVKAKEKK